MLAYAQATLQPLRRRGLPRFRFGRCPGAVQSTAESPRATVVSCFLCARPWTMSKGFKKSEERLQVSVQHQAEEAQSDQDGAEKERKSHAEKHAHRALTFFGGFL
jgi:hypothetical protein